MKRWSHVSTTVLMWKKRALFAATVSLKMSMEYLTLGQSPLHVRKQNGIFYLVLIFCWSFVIQTSFILCYLVRNLNLICFSLVGKVTSFFFSFNKVRSFLFEHEADPWVFFITERLASHGSDIQKRRIKNERYVSWALLLSCHEFRIQMFVFSEVARPGLMLANACLTQGICGQTNQKNSLLYHPQKNMTVSLSPWSDRR